MRLSRQTLKEVAPWATRGVRLGRWAKNQVTFPIAASVVEWRSAGRVMGGPFKGLRAPGSGTSPGHYAVLMGIYEAPLVPVVEAVIARAPATIIDVGAHWGYYALGFAVRCPASRVIAYEVDATRADLLRRYRGLNGVDARVEVRGACTVESLARDVAERPDPFLLVDVDGAEDALLDPGRAPGLRRAEILVELHDHFVPGVARRLRERFAATHAQRLIPPGAAPVDPALIGWAARYGTLRRLAVRMAREGREAEVSWLHLVPRCQARAGLERE